MSYDTTILADSPVWYIKCDDLPGSSQLLDYAGGSNHIATMDEAVFTIAGPIETDSPNYGASSQVVRSGVGIFGLARYPAPVPSAIDPRTILTYETWGYAIAGNAHGNQMWRSGSSVGGAANKIGITGTTATFKLRFPSGDFSLVSGTLAVGAWYHLVGTRNAGTMLFYVNGVLVAQSTSLPAGEDVSVSGDNGWVLGAVAGADVCPGVARCAVYNTALNSTRVLAHYEAAKLSLPLRATIVISLGVELNTDQVTPTDLGFAHNYSETFGDSQIPITEEIAYKTNVNQSEPDYQQRVGARPHGAYRTLEYHLSPSSGAGRARLQGALYAPAQTYCLPVWTDAGVTTGAANSGAAIIPVDTTKRDYEVGSYVGACTDLQNPSTFQFHKILTVADAQLTLTANIATTIPSGSPVFPARLVSISDDSLSVKSFAADHEDSVIRFEVLESELSTRRITAYTPGTTYKSIEVFSLETAKVNFLDDRPYNIDRRIEGRGRDYQYAKDSGSPQTFPVRFLLTTRAALSEVFGWLDARQGKLNPVWVSSRERDLTVTGVTGQTVTVSPKTGFAFHHGRRDIEFLKTDGSYVRLRVISVTDNGSSESWVFDPAGAAVPAFGLISRASFLKYCVLSSDVVQLRYYKGGSSGSVIAECVVSFSELLTSPA